MIEPPFKACKGISGVWIEAANGLVVANMNDLLADEADLFEIAELFAVGANERCGHSTAEPRVNTTDQSKKN